MAATVKAKGSVRRGRCGRRKRTLSCSRACSARAQKWSLIADKLQELFQNKTKRTGKQCRTRWLNHLDPNINKGP